MCSNDRVIRRYFPLFYMKKNGILNTFSVTFFFNVLTFFRFFCEIFKFVLVLFDFADVVNTTKDVIYFPIFVKTIWTQITTLNQILRNQIKYYKSRLQWPMLQLYNSLFLIPHTIFESFFLLFIYLIHVKRDERFIYSVDFNVFLLSWQQFLQYNLFFRIVPSQLKNFKSTE
jgi:hypothetical protein